MRRQRVVGPQQHRGEQHLQGRRSEAERGRQRTGTCAPTWQELWRKVLCPPWAVCGPGERAGRWPARWRSVSVVAGHVHVGAIRPQVESAARCLAPAAGQPQDRLRAPQPWPRRPRTTSRSRRSSRRCLQPAPTTLDHRRRRRLTRNHTLTLPSTLRPRPRPRRLQAAAEDAKSRTNASP